MRRWTFRVLSAGRTAAYPSWWAVNIAVVAAASACTAVSIAAPLCVLGLPGGEPYADLAGIVTEFLWLLPPLAGILAVLILIPLALAGFTVNVIAELTPSERTWRVSLGLRVTLASALVLPLPALLISAIGVIGVAANPDLFWSNSAPVPESLAWLLPLMLLLAVTGLPTLWWVAAAAAWRATRATTTARDGVCRECGYSLVGLRTGVCPECGVQAAVGTVK